MKRLLLLLGVLIFTIISTQASALTIDIYTNVDNLFILEDFENVDAGWYQTLGGSLGSAVGTFRATGEKGTGATSYEDNVDSNSNAAYFSIQNRSQSWYGRYNTTEDGSKWLDSGDITELTLDVATGLGSTLNSLYFYMIDPSDCGATTSVNGVEQTVTASYDFASEPNGGKHLVGITWEEGETLTSITWSTNGHTGDGYGLDDFATVAAPVPEPATMMLFGIGLLGLAGVSRRKK